MGKNNDKKKQKSFINFSRQILEGIGKTWEKVISLTRRKVTGRVDPVANFHLSNGARIERLNWMGDTSEKGLKQSVGIMVNYYYKLSDIEKNHERYSGRSLITASGEVSKWL